MNFITKLKVVGIVLASGIFVTMGAALIIIISTTILGL